ncbi:MAG: YHYH domain-containing protein [Bacteroidetes bacterium]|nr:YHYH domain-containing protein [Bacteroidota bacterium]
MIKRITIVLLALFIVTTISFGHGGRTDKNGGHYNRKTGEYHYHNGGSTDSDGSGGIVVVVVLGLALIWLVGYNLSKK